MNFVFDVETTGLPEWGRGFRDLDAFEGARLLSISWILLHNEVPIEQSYYLVSPDDFEISPESTRIHGITKKLAIEIGLPIKKVLTMAWEAMSKCRALVAHNIHFDRSIMLSEFHRAGMQDAVECVMQKSHVCTMRKGKDVMALKKFPKLGELYKFLYDEEITNAHDAQYDTLYCYKCFLKMFPKDKDSFYFGEKEVRLTPEQQRIVYEDHDKNMLVIACAGSGKSSTMLCRIKHLIDSGVPDTAIIMTTFTRDAANDMRDKLFNIMGYKPNIKLGTIDSLAKYYTENNMGTNDPSSLKHVSEYSHYFLEYLKRCGPQFFQQFKYLFVDEFQDINKTQYEIIKCFTKHGIRLFAVGDDAQNIYTFRGSSIEYILNFGKLFKNSSILKLSTNFRCSPEIVNMANASIEKNANQIPKVMVASERPRKKPRVQYFSYPKFQNQHVVSLIESYIGSGVVEHNIAVLSPTNQGLYMIEEDLTKKGISHVLLDGKSDVRTRIKSGNVCLSTIHKSKGLEWDIVILINMSDDVIPKVKNEKAEEEERRLFYVAVTRARHDLHILYSAHKLGPYITRYVSELDRSLYDFVDFKKEYVLGKSSFDVVTMEKSVTKLIELLDGNDYVVMKKAGMFPENAPTKTKLFPACDYTRTIEAEEIYADFGIFVDYCITRILAQAYHKPCQSKQALQTLACVTLENSDYSIYRFYKDNFRLNVKDAADNYCNRRASKILLERGAKPISDEHMDTLTHILKKIKEHSMTYGIPVGNIPVFNYRFLPEGFEMTIKRSHDVFSNLDIQWKDCMNDIWEVSKCNRVVSEYRRRLLFKTIKGEDFLETYKSMFENIQEHFVKTLSAAQADTDVFLHEEFSISEGVHGELDLRVGDTIVEFKTTINEDINMEWLLQLLCYKVLYEWQPENKGKVIKTIAIFNPLKGLYFSLDVSTWNKHRELVQYLLQKREMQINLCSKSSSPCED